MQWLTHKNRLDQALPLPFGDETIVQPAAHAGEPAKASSLKRKIVAGSGPHLPKETEELLRLRLRAAALILLIGFGAFLIRHVVGVLTGEPLFPVLLGFHMLVVVVLSLITAPLWWHSDVSIKKPRISELVIIGLPAAFFLMLQHRATLEDVGHYVMEYRPGLSLEDLLKRRGPLPAERVVHLLRQTCHALREAHGVGLIHRDIKPGNVIASQRGGLYDVVKLLDFGLVKPVNENPSARLSQEGGISDTLLFMSPEQARGQSDLDAKVVCKTSRRRRQTQPTPSRPGAPDDGSLQLSRVRGSLSAKPPPTPDPFDRRRGEP